MNLGAGRIVYQDLTRVDAAIEDGSFFDNAELVPPAATPSASGGTLHVMGLLSPGGVHSHESHIFAMLELAQRAGVRASPCMPSSTAATPRRARPKPACARLQALCDTLGNARIASVGGRYFAMDRDKRWDRVRWLGRDRRGRRGEHRASDAIGGTAGRLRARRERRIRAADGDRRRLAACATATRWCS